MTREVKEGKLVGSFEEKLINQIGKDLADGDLLKGILYFRERK